MEQVGKPSDSRLVKQSGSRRQEIAPESTEFYSLSTCLANNRFPKKSGKFDLRKDQFLYYVKNINYDNSNITLDLSCYLY